MKENNKTDSVKDSLAKMDTPKKDISRFPEALIKQAKEESRLVKGRFKNYKHPGEMLEIKQRKFHPDLAPGFKKMMIDEGIYEIPLWVARWLNGVDAGAPKINGQLNSCRYPVHGFTQQNPNEVKYGRQDPMGIPSPILTEPARWERRFGFESLDFDTNVA